MFIVWSWLKDYIDLTGCEPEAIAKVLTDLGIEVEGIKKQAGLDKKIIVAEIKSAKRHPNADSLQLCSVSTGSEECAVVCGAPNARVGLKVALATVDAILPDGMVIKKGKIRGESSFGMLCSEKELGLSDNHDGIVELANEFQVGRPLCDYIKTDDVILELSITPNRADCLSYIGIARELSAKLGLSLKMPVLDEFARSSNFSTESICKIKLEHDVGCNRFAAIYGKGVKAIPSPTWLQKRLSASGMRPINIIVDATNYVMLETGQPIHAYDRRFVEGGVIGVRSAFKGEKLVTLDRAEISLEPGDLLIHDGKKAIGLAGIMGGENSEVKDDTTELLIEVAQFAPAQIRKTARRVGILSEAAYRFERGIDVSQIPWVCERVASLITTCLREQGIEDAQFSESMLDVYPKEQIKPRIALRLGRVRKILALPFLSLDTCIKHLKALGFELVDHTDERMLFDVPLWRHDMVREIDLIEEIARLEGYGKIASELPRMDIGPNYEDPFVAFCEDVQRVMALGGFSEIVTYPFQSLQSYQKLGLNENHPLWPTLKLANPLNEEMGFLRTTLSVNLLASALHNRHHGIKGSRLFQMGRGFFDFGERKIHDDQYPLFKDLIRPGRHLTPRASKETGRVVERHLVAGLLDAPYLSKNWQKNQEEPGFFHGKAAIWTLIKAFGSSDKLEVRRPLVGELPFLHPGASAVILIGEQELGYVGELHPKIARDYDLKDDSIVIFELDCEKFFLACQKNIITQSYSKRFPPVTRDLAFIVNKTLSYEQFMAAVHSFAKKVHLNSCHLFDVYEGESIPCDKKSFAISVSFHSFEKTLTDSEVDKEVEALKTWLAERIQASLRGMSEPVLS